MDDIFYEAREDSYLLQKYVEQYCKSGFLVLDMGTGSGIQAITAARTAKKVIASDININAIHYAKNAAKVEHLSNIEFIESDLFTKIPNKRFDLIIFNPPYLPKEKHIENTALFSAKRGCDTAITFLDAAGRFLTEDGIILLISSSLASQSLMNEAFERNLYSMQILEKEHIFFEDIIMFAIQKSDLIKKLEKMHVSGAKLFARGKRGIIIKGEFRKKPVAIKIKKPGIGAMGTIENEARFLKILNKHKIGARLIFCNEEMIMYKFVEGMFIFDFVRESGKRLIIKVLKKIYLQMRLLDQLGINKFEMHHPAKHILVEKEAPVLIDFERARFTEDPKNVSQFCDFLIGHDMNALLREKGIEIRKPEMIKAAREYKEKMNLASFKKIISLIC